MSACLRFLDAARADPSLDFPRERHDIELRGLELADAVDAGLVVAAAVDVDDLLEEVERICDALDRLRPVAAPRRSLITYVADRPGHDHRYAIDPAKLEDFLGAIVNIYGPRMLRYKGVLNMRGTERKVIFQGVHQLMGSDLGPMWAEGEVKMSKMVFIGIDLPKDILLQGLEQCLV